MTLGHLPLGHLPCTRRSLHSLLLIGAGGSRVIKRNYLRSDLSIYQLPFLFHPDSDPIIRKGREGSAGRLGSSSPPPSLSWVDSQFS